jgi:N4-gp56 family major capsid protein
MATTTYAPSVAADINTYLSKDLLPLTIKELVAYNFADKMTLPKGRGTTFTMSRYARNPLPIAPTAEGVPPIATPLTVSQATVAVQQWTGLITITDVVQLTIFHDVFAIAKERIAMMASETMERNTFEAFTGFTQVNYVNTRGARGSLLATDVLNTYELQRAYAQLKTLGAPMFRGQPYGSGKASDNQISASGKDAHRDALRAPSSSPHYVALVHPLVAADLRTNPQVQLASAYSDINRLYNGEFGQWNAIRFVESNMVPYWTGQAAPTGTAPYSITPVATGGAFAAGTYQFVITQSDTLLQYENIVTVQSGNFTVAANGSVTITLPASSGGTYTYSVYVSATNGTTVQNLALCAAGPTSGSLQGQATFLTAGTTVTLTGIGIGRVPPAAPAAGITVYPTYVFGREAYAVVTLDELKVEYLDKAEKVDPANQLRMVSFKYYNGTFIKNNAFAMRIESASQFNVTFG